jgi:signal transduction histidine kinase/FixJ family two-component response regulator
MLFQKIIITVSAVLILAGQSASAQTSDGKITIDDTATITLSGKWYFKNKKHISAGEMAGDFSGWDAISNNLSWTSYPQFSEYHGIAWYGLNCIINNNLQNLSLLVPVHYRGAQFFFNRTLIYETRPFNERGDSPLIVGKPDLIKIPAMIIRPGNNVLLIKTGTLSSDGGFDGSMRIGGFGEIKREWLYYLFRFATLTVINLFLSIYFLIIYWNRRKDKYYLYFSILSLSLGLWIGGYKGLILWLIDYYSVYLFTTYICSFLASVMLLQFIHSFLSIKSNIIEKLFTGLYAFMSLWIVIEYIVFNQIEYFTKYIYFPFIFISLMLLVYGNIICIKSMRDKKPYAGMTFMGFFLLTAGYAYSILTFMDIIKSEAVLIEGFFAMTLVFAWVLASRFAQVHTDLETAHGELLVMDKMKDEFLATTSHELRTPLHGIIGLTQSLQSRGSGPVTEQQMEDLLLIESSAQRLNRLVEEILDFSKIRAGRVDLFLGEVRLDTVIPSLVSLSRGLLGEKSLELKYELAPDLPAIMGDKERIEQVLLNLIGNAIKFTATGSVTVSAVPEEGGVHITVSDTGKGISREKLERIWNPYEQADDADSRESGGTGLGLAIARHLVELHGGRIWAGSEPGLGSDFHVFIPLEPPRNMAGISRRKMEQAETLPSVIIDPGMNQAKIMQEISDIDARSAGGGGDTVLLVDDDPVNLKILQRILAEEGYTTATARTGPEALEIIARQRPQCILLDLMLPGMSGYDVMMQLRSRYREEFLPVIMVTARNQMEDMVKGFIFGCNDYLTKPFNPRELLVRVENQLVMKHFFDTERHVNRDLEGNNHDAPSPLERSRLFSDTVRKLRDWENIIAKDLVLSQNFLEKMMNRELRTDRVAACLHYDPLITIGGDLYDMEELPDGRVRFFMADATGHGINASMNLITILSEYNLLKREDLSPARLMEQLNNRFCMEQAPYHIVFTCCLADIDLHAGTLTVASAGHPKQYCTLPGGEIKDLWTRRPIIGMMNNLEYHEITCDFPPGSTLFLFTDGLIEGYAGRPASEHDNRRIIKGESYLRETIGKNAVGDNVEAMCRDIIIDMKGDYKKNRLDDDDITLMVVRRLS